MAWWATSSPASTGFELGTDVFLPLFLPPLLFTAGLTHRRAPPVRRGLRGPAHGDRGVLVCIAGVASAVHLATGIDLTVCLLLGPSCRPPIRRR